MGQAALSERVTLYPARVDNTYNVRHVERKGIGLTFPTLLVEIVHLGVLERQRKQTQKRRLKFREEFSFLCKERNPWNRVIRR